jgi:hypothetical protein
MGCARRGGWGAGQTHLIFLNGTDSRLSDGSFRLGFYTGSGRAGLFPPGTCGSVRAGACSLLALANMYYGSAVSLAFHAGAFACQCM